MVIAIMSATSIKSGTADVDRQRFVANSLQELRSYQETKFADICDNAEGDGEYVAVAIHELIGATAEELIEHRAWLEKREYRFVLCGR
ncbi:hypothetical protein EVC12_052 [Rhizobium phage RHph_I42]|nr:hypothetical protein EVC12_052 [Rhizobium phage RHph_I42]